MKDCEQSKGQSVLQHGFSVKNYLFDLLSYLRRGTPLKYDWVLPDWIYEKKDLILSSLPSDYTLKLYTIFHDVGKPMCLTVGEDGKRHFPNHAEVSYQIFSQLFDNPIAADLIKHDMDIHLLKADGVKNFMAIPNFLTLLIVGLSEVHSNSSMFGGNQSVSFKIKIKSLIQRGKQIFNLIESK